MNPLQILGSIAQITAKAALSGAFTAGAAHLIGRQLTRPTPNNQNTNNTEHPTVVIARSMEEAMNGSHA